MNMKKTLFAICLMMICSLAVNAQKYALIDME